MKSFLIFLFAVLLLASKTKYSGAASIDDKPVIQIDTTIDGKPGTKGSSISIRHNIVGRYSTEWHYKYWVDKNKVEFKHQYYDSLLMPRYVYCLFWDEKKCRLSHSWSDKDGNAIIGIDSVFLNNKLTSTELTLWKEKQDGYDNLDFDITKYYKNNKVYETSIYDFNDNHKYSERGKDYFEMDIDVEYQYAAWEGSSQSRFARSHSDALKLLSRIPEMIEAKYLVIAKEKHGIDLQKFIKKELGN